jgi:hypothetical protein
MDRKSWVFIGLLILGFGIGFYGLATETGPVGWLNALQQRILGSYYSFFSLMIVVFAVMAAGLVLWHWVGKLLGLETQGPGAQPGAPEPPPLAMEGGRVQPYPAPPKRPASPGRTYFITAVVITAATWVVGGALYGRRVMTLRGDASAVYQPVELLDGRPMPVLSEQHLALRCIPVPELAVVFKSGSVEDYRLVAVVGLGWEPDHPVQVVAKLETSQTLDLGPDSGQTPRELTEIQLLVRRLGPVPVPALAEFRKMRAPLADNVIMVTPVAAKDGKPYLPDTGIDLGMMVVICGLITLATVVWTTVKWLRRRSAMGKA